MNEIKSELLKQAIEDIEAMHVTAYANVRTSLEKDFKKKPEPLTEIDRYKEALKAAYETIEFMRVQVNEINLLNAKLLYTNKLFKEFDSVITEPFRLKIVDAFDLAKSIREVKLVYVMTAEGLNHLINKQ